MTPFIYVDILNVIILRNDKSTGALLQKVDVCDVISIVINVLIIIHHLRLEQWTNPRDEGARLVDH
jgi:hypothetical protein